MHWPTVIFTYQMLVYNVIIGIYEDPGRCVLVVIPARFPMMECVDVRCNFKHFTDIVFSKEKIAK